MLRHGVDPQSIDVCIGVFAVWTLELLETGKTMKGKHESGQQRMSYIGGRRMTTDVQNGQEVEQRRLPAAPSPRQILVSSGEARCSYWRAAWQVRSQVDPAQAEEQKVLQQNERKKSFTISPGSCFH